MDFRRKISAISLTARIVKSYFAFEKALTLVTSWCGWDGSDVISHRIKTSLVTRLGSLSTWQWAKCSLPKVWIDVKPRGDDNKKKPIVDSIGPKFEHFTKSQICMQENFLRREDGVSEDHSPIIDWPGSKSSREEPTSHRTVSLISKIHPSDTMDWLRPPICNLHKQLHPHFTIQVASVYKSVLMKPHQVSSLAL